MTINKDKNIKLSCGARLIPVDQVMQFSSFGYAVLSIILVTLIPAATFILWIYDRSHMRNHSWIVFLAIGALLGNAIFHLIPEALGIDESELPVGVLLCLFAGIVTFLFGEQLLQQYHHGHGHNHFSQTDFDQAVEEGLEPEHQHEHITGHFGPLLAASDILHSFVDGIAIGTSFLSSTATGIATSFAVFLHEVPHLLGDYAVLASSGFTKLQLVYYSGLVVLSSITGAGLVNILTSVIPESMKMSIERGLLAFAAGNFLYISLADLIPEVLVKRSSSNKARLIGYCCILVGATAILMLRYFIKS